MSWGDNRGYNTVGDNTAVGDNTGFNIVGDRGYSTLDDKNSIE